MSQEKQPPKAVAQSFDIDAGKLASDAQKLVTFLGQIMEYPLGYGVVVIKYAFDHLCKANNIDPESITITVSPTKPDEPLIKIIK